MACCITGIMDFWLALWLAGLLYLWYNSYPTDSLIGWPEVSLDELIYDWLSHWLARCITRIMAILMGIWLTSLLYHWNYGFITASLIGRPAVSLEELIYDWPSYLLACCITWQIYIWLAPWLAGLLYHWKNCYLTGSLIGWPAVSLE